MKSVKNNMGKKLAIRGHSTRGKEVIELLEMMGGKNNCDSSADNLGLSYLIDDEFDICAHYFGYDDYEDGELNIFTLEEFLEKYPFKVGDKVIDEADGCPGVVCEMKWDEDVSDMKYCVAFGNGIDFGWFANDSIEFYKENENSKDIATNVEETQSKRDIDKAEFMIKHMILPNKMDDKLEYEIIDGYEFDKVENGKIILKPIKPKYPNNFDDCFNTVADELNDNKEVEYFEYKYDLLDKFKQLLICRDAYWKIAGEEMGLGKPWDSAYGCGEWGYWIGYNINENKIYLQDSRILVNHALVFPTAEMRDAFYENFKDLIEQCKELL